MASGRPASLRTVVRKCCFGISVRLWVSRLTSYDAMQLTSYRLSSMKDNWSVSSLACEYALLVFSRISSRNSFRASNDNLPSARKSSRSRTSRQISMAASLQFKLLSMTGKKASTSTLVRPMSCLVVLSFRSLGTSMNKNPRIMKTRH